MIGPRPAPAKKIRYVEVCRTVTDEVVLGIHSEAVTDGLWTTRAGALRLAWDLVRAALR
jgi:hypothetical protein